MRRFQFTLLRSGCQVKVHNSTRSTFPVSSFVLKVQFLYLQDYIHSVVNHQIPIVMGISNLAFVYHGKCFYITTYVIVKRWKIMYLQDKRKLEEEISGIVDRKEEQPKYYEKVIVSNWAYFFTITLRLKTSQSTINCCFLLFYCRT